MRLISKLPRTQWVRIKSGYTKGKVYQPCDCLTCVYDDDGDLRPFFPWNYEQKPLWTTGMHRFFRRLFRLES